MLRDEDGGICLKISFFKLGCSSMMMSFSLFANVGVGSFSIFCKHNHHKVSQRFPSCNYLCP